jgi:hypothetical protein
MKKTIIIALVLMSFGVFAQGNLQFNQAINITGLGTYTVPTGKVLKIESINIGEICAPAVSSTLINCPGGGYTVPVYRPVDYLNISGMQFSSGSVVEACGYFPSPPPCRTVPSSSKVISLPIWLNAGKTITTSSSGTLNLIISGIEFNIVA